MKPVVINDEAAEELDEAIRYYESKSRGIGLNLATQVSQAFQRIQANPQRYPFHGNEGTKVLGPKVSLHSVLFGAGRSDRRYRRCTPETQT